MTPEKEQRVNIQYSVKVSELPELLDEMLAAAEKKLCSVVSEFKQHNITEVLREHEGFQFSADRITELRSVLADLDYRFADCTAMLQGMAQLKANPPQSPTPTGIENRMDEINEAVAKTEAMVKQANQQKSEENQQ